uniref:Uncharacterized protein n=1 Tax=Anguilla anguilla TaxID=7936 RepID=A0A0E9T5E6_ANGAN
MPELNTVESFKRMQQISK